MRTRHPLPRFWLFSDERMGDSFLAAVARLPKGRAGVIFRHYRTPPPERNMLLRRVSQIARRRRLVLLVAGDDSGIHRWDRDGHHGLRTARAVSPGLVSAPVHNLAQIRQAEKMRADLIFLSPVFATESHPGASTLGRHRFALLARQTRLPVAALGGVDMRRFQALRKLGAYGFGAIGAWIRN